MQKRRETQNQKSVPSLKKTKNRPKVKQILLHADNPGKYFRATSSRRPGRSGIPDLGSSIKPVAVLIAAACLFYFIFVRLAALMRGERQRGASLSRGRWVRDRSLGGKEVFVASEGLNWNPLGADTMQTEVHKSALPESTPLPPWWKARTYIHINASKKEEGRITATRIVKALDEQRVTGRDYSFDLLLELYLTCKDAYISAKTSSVNIATNMFRYAVRHTVALTADGIGLSYGLDPIEFMCQLSEMLRLHSSSAIGIIHGETASKLRSALLQAFADVRSQQQSGKPSGYGLRSVLYILSHLPLPRSDAELIGSSITSTTTEQERIRVYALLCEAGPEFEAMIGALLGKLEVQTLDD